MCDSKRDFLGLRNAARTNRRSTNTMNSIWQRLKNLYPTKQRKKSSPRMADVAMEVLQNLGEEAKDVVYYEALNRVHGVSAQI